MSTQVFFVSSQTEGKRKVFLEWTSIELSSKLSFTCGVNINYYKSVRHHVLTVPPGIENTLTITQANQYWAVRYILCLAKFRVIGRFLLEGVRSGATLWEHLAVIRDEKLSPFVKFKIILSLPCFLLDSLTNKQWRTLIFMINLRIDSSTRKK